jgi:hypothetical protein
MLCSLFLSYGNENTKKEALTVEFPLTLWPIWMMHNIFLLFYVVKIPLLDSFINYETSTMLNNGTLSHSSRLIFNIDR